MTFSPDLINGLIELVGAGLTWRNAWQLHTDRQIRGVYWPTTLFFALWGFWNLFYYPFLDQWISFTAGVVLVSGNVIWVAMAIHISKNQPGEIMKQTGFIPIPETTLPGGLVVPAFQIAQYACSQNNGKLAISAEGTPWVHINYANAVKACEAEGYQLTRESQRLAVAYHIATQDENWTGGKVGSGKLFQGLRKWNVDGPKPASYVPKDEDERRWFALPGDHRIYDIAGNVWEWIFDDVQGDDKGLIAKAFKADSPSLVIPYPNEDKGQGWTPSVGSNWSGYALVRGGCWNSGSRAGAFRLIGGWPDREGDGVGFRCTKPGI